MSLPKNEQWKQHKKYVIAIDFGTRGTAVRYCRVGDKSVTLLRNWNEARTKYDGGNKTDTCIALKPSTKNKNKFETDSFGQWARVKAEEEKGCMLFEGFKTKLFQESLTDHFKKHLKATNGKRIKTEYVFVHALTHIAKRAMETIREKEGKKDITFDDVQWTLTVPAIYTDIAKQKMREWMIKALQNIGCTNKSNGNQILICLEPECAALNLFTQHQLKLGTEYMLVDLGGGTADICLHRVTGSIQVAEMASPSGGPWGMDKVNTELIKILSDMFGADAIEQFRREKVPDYLELLANLDKKKHSFLSDTSHLKRVRKSKKLRETFHTIALPSEFVKFIESNPSKANSDSEFNGMAETKDSDDDSDIEYIAGLVDSYNYKGKHKGECRIQDKASLRISLSIWIDIFNIVVKPLMEQMHKLLVKHPSLTHIAMVGGGSLSEYVKFRVQSEIIDKRESSNHPIKLIFVKEPMLCVVKGAVEFAMNRGFVFRRVMKYTYGVGCSRPIEIAQAHPNISREHIEKKKYYSKFEQKDYVNYCFDVFVRKGETVPFNHEIQKTYGAHPTASGLYTPVYASTDTNPGVTTGLPIIKEIEIPYPPNADLSKLEFRTTFYFGDTLIRVKSEILGFKDKVKEAEFEFKK